MAKAKGTSQSDEGKPSQEHEKYWLRAHNPHAKEPDELKVGKWMLFIPVESIDEVWEQIRVATETGMLGIEAKVATMKENPNAVRSDAKLVCVYTRDYEDKEDVLQVLKVLREMGFDQRLNYKTDVATLSNEYSFNTSGPVSMYTSDPGSLEMHPPKSRKQPQKHR